jgi:hypothetical protein
MGIVKRLGENTELSTIERGSTGNGGCSVPYLKVERLRVDQSMA